MIDREKVAIMNREAMMQKKNRRRSFPATHYYMFDYVSFQVIKGILGATVIFAMAAACWLAYTLESWISTISLEGLLALAIHMGRIYLMVMAGVAVVLAAVYTLRYFQSVKSVREEVSQLKRLERYYILEDRKWGE